MVFVYLSDLTEAEWALVDSPIPAIQRRGALAGTGAVLPACNTEVM